MSTNSRLEYLTVEVPVSLWQRVDGCVDNTTALDVVDGIIPSVIAGSCVRDAGWRAADSYPGDLDQFGWPPHDYSLPVTLRRSHWEWTASQMERWAPNATDDSYATALQLIRVGLERLID